MSDCEFWCSYEVYCEVHGTLVVFESSNTADMHLSVCTRAHLFCHTMEKQAASAFRHAAIKVILLPT